jgi:hypothetical protein
MSRTEELNGKFLNLLIGTSSGTVSTERVRLVFPVFRTTVYMLHDMEV